mgnify:CR=1 FL=1
MKRQIIFTALLLSAALLTAQPVFETITNISYKDGDAYTKERCLLDIRTPANPGSYPVVIWFHGGGLTGGNKYFPGELLNEEMVMVTVNYRLSPNVEVTAILDDAAAAVAWVFRNIAGYNGDADHIIVSGHSAGGYLTSMVGLDPTWLNKYDIDANRIHALFPFSGHTITHFTVRQERDIPGTQPVIDAMAPLFHVRKDAPPLYLMTGDRELEMLGRYEENAYMWRMMQVVGHTGTYLFEFDGHDHGAMVAPGCHVLLEYIEDLK